MFKNTEVFMIWAQNLMVRDVKQQNSRSYTTQTAFGRYRGRKSTNKVAKTASYCYNNMYAHNAKILKKCNSGFVVSCKL